LKGFIRNAATTAALALVAGIAGVVVGGRFLPPQAQPSLHDAIHRDLRLSAAQNTEIDALEAEFAGRRAALEAEMRAANAELARAIQANEAMGPDVEAAVRHFHQAMGSLQTETIEHVFSMRRVLTQDQRTRFDELVVKALTSDQQ
jgi:hypothetical protein